MRIDGHQVTELHTFAQNTPKASFSGESMASQASAALAEMRSEAIEETMESLSLGLSSMARRLNVGGKEQNPMMDGVEKLLQQMDKMARQSINRIAEQLSRFSDAGQMFKAMESSGLEKGQMALVLTALLGFKGLPPSIRKQLKQRLIDILAEEEIELEILAASQGLNVGKEGLRAVRQLYQNAKRGEQGLAHWFELLKQHQDRRQYIRVLIRAMAEPLDQGQTRDDMTKVVATIDDLKRLLLFMTFEDHCQSLAKATGLDPHRVMSVTIELLEQSWTYPDALSLIIGRLPLVEERKVIFLRRWKGLMAVMSEGCYRDVEQKEHVQEVMLELLDQWND
ncbi:HrpJ domain-containing protein [Vibrio ostreicida]|uniref:HrpJ domain-containing protein n=1 Tax=Vibrio ostreicida TaxID=526588 RepID=UPI003B5A4EF4